MNKSVTIAALSALILGSAAFAQDSESRTSSEDRAPEATAASSRLADSEALDESDPGEEVVCRRERATGSLTRVRRVCMTRNEWNGIYDNTRDAMIATNRGASGGKECILDPAGGCR